MKNSAKPDWNVGYTTRQHLCIDLDYTSLPKTFSLASLIIEEYPEVGDCLIIESSLKPLNIKLCHMPQKLPYHKITRSSYHIIFDGIIPYERSCQIIETLAELGVINEQYVHIREMRNDMTLRVSKTVCVEQVKPVPCIVGYVLCPKQPKKKGGIGLYLNLLHCFMFQASDCCSLLSEGTN